MAKDLKPLSLLNQPRRTNAQKAIILVRNIDTDFYLSRLSPCVQPSVPSSVYTDFIDRHSTLGPSKPEHR